MLTKLGPQFKKNHSEVQHQLGFAGSESSLRRILKQQSRRGGGVGHVCLNLNFRQIFP